MSVDHHQFLSRTAGIAAVALGLFLPGCGLGEAKQAGSPTSERTVPTPTTSPAMDKTELLARHNRIASRLFLTSLNPESYLSIFPPAGEDNIQSTINDAGYGYNYLFGGFGMAFKDPVLVQGYGPLAFFRASITTVYGSEGEKSRLGQILGYGFQLQPLERHAISPEALSSLAEALIRWPAEGRRRWWDDMKPAGNGSISDIPIKWGEVVAGGEGDVLKAGKTYPNSLRCGIDATGSLLCLFSGSAMPQTD